MKIVTIKTDQRLEFCNQGFHASLGKQCISHEKTDTYGSEMNGVAERFNVTALDGVKTLLKSSGVSQKFWGEALVFYMYEIVSVCKVFF